MYNFEINFMLELLICINCINKHILHKDAWWCKSEYIYILNYTLRIFISVIETWGLQGKEKRLRCTCPVGQWVFCFPCPTLNSTLVLWASWKELKEQVCFMACPGIYVLNVYLSFGWVQTRTHTCTTDTISGHALCFRTLDCRRFL